MKKHLIIIGLVVLVVGSIALFSRTADREVVSQEPTTDPLDEVIDFYNAWLDAAKATSTDAQFSGVIESPVLSAGLKEEIQAKLTETKEGALDPVLCQPEPPERIGGKVLYHLETTAEIMMLARGGEEKAANQAIVTLAAENGSWVITGIKCATGELPPERDFDFEQEGFLLKNVPPPLNSDYWHLVFEQQGVMGHTAPLFFDPESICVDTERTETVCDPEQFAEATKVYVQADMTESGAVVKRLRFLQ